MFNKTTSFIFNKYGEIVNDFNRRQSLKLSTSTVKLKDKSFDEFYSYNSDVYVKVLSGIVMLVAFTGDNGVRIMLNCLFPEFKPV